MNSESLLLVKALDDVGVKVDSVYDLVNSKTPYPEAIPVLIEHLSLGASDDDNFREGIVRALTVKEAVGISGPALLTEFKKAAKSPVGWAVGNALGFTMTARELNEVLEIAMDPANGTARQMLVLALSKFKDNDRVEMALIALLDDKDVVLQAIDALRKLRSKKAIPAVEALRRSVRRDVARAADRCVKKLESL